jgi:hypothetical protein
VTLLETAAAELRRTGVVYVIDGSGSVHVMSARAYVRALRAGELEGCDSALTSIGAALKAARARRRS